MLKGAGNRRFGVHDIAATRHRLAAVSKPLHKLFGSHLVIIIFPHKMNYAVASVLNKVLGEFVQDLDSSNLNIGIFSGDINLHNLRVKVDALKKFGFP